MLDGSPARRLGLAISEWDRFRVSQEVHFLDPSEVVRGMSCFQPEGRRKCRKRRREGRSVIYKLVENVSLLWGEKEKRRRADDRHLPVFYHFMSG